jgi:hypothetical protein
VGTNGEFDVSCGSIYLLFSSFLSHASREERASDSYRPNSSLKAKAFDVSILHKTLTPKSSFDTPSTVEVVSGCVC